MIQLIGILIVVNTLIASAWWLSQGKPWGLAFTSVAVLASLVGLALVFNERAIELSFGKFGKIKAAAQQAETDAKEIADIRKRVEAQAATMDLVAKESAEAKKLLSDLTEQNKVAGEKLKELGERTSEVVRLPDGRTKFGNIITGKPSALQDKLDAGLAAYRQKNYSAAHDEFVACVSLYETSKDQQGDVAMISGGVNVDAIATACALAAETAQRTGKNDVALEYARKSVDLAPTPERQAMLALCLFKSGEAEEANKMLEDRKAKDDDDSKKFIQTLTDWGALGKQSNK